MKELRERIKDIEKKVHKQINEGLLSLRLDILNK